MEESKTRNSTAEILVEDVIIDIEMLYTKASKVVEDPLPDYVSATGSKRCIFRTPCILSRHNESSYAPNAFSIGPWHFGKPHLRATTDLKMLYLKDFITRARAANPETLLNVEDLKKDVEEVEEDARACYGGSVKFDKKEFCNILMLDGCFIVELFCKYHEILISNQPFLQIEDPLLSMSCMFQFLSHDLILLENQVPWLVLQRLLSKVHLSESELVETAHQFFRNSDPSKRKVETIVNNTEQPIKHIVDLLRKFWVPQDQENSQQLLEPAKRHLILNACKLDEAGVRFEGIEGTVLDLKFDKGVLKIPFMEIDETTETMFRNVISFEQCSPNCPPRVSSFAKFLDDLIDTTDDMEILCNNGIVSNWSELKDATEFFNRLHTDMCLKTDYHDELCKQLRKYCERTWPRWRALMVRNYLNKPWAMLSLAFATIISVFSAIKVFLPK